MTRKPPRAARPHSPPSMALPTAAPPNALKMWTDGTRIYVELPGSTGKPPYIVAHLFSEAGLSKALDLLGTRRADYDYIGTVPSEYSPYRSNLTPVKLVGTPQQHAAAQKLLRQKGIIK